MAMILVIDNRINMSRGICTFTERGDGGLGCPKARRGREQDEVLTQQLPVMCTSGESSEILPMPGFQDSKVPNIDRVFGGSLP